MLSSSHSQGKCDEAKILHERCLVIRVQTLGSDHLDVAESLNNHAVLLHGQVRAVKLPQKYLLAPVLNRALFESVVGPVPRRQHVPLAFKACSWKRSFVGLFTAKKARREVVEILPGVIIKPAPAFATTGRS